MSAGSGPYTLRRPSPRGFVTRRAGTRCVPSSQDDVELRRRWGRREEGVPEERRSRYLRGAMATPGGHRGKRKAPPCLSPGSFVTRSLLAVLSASARSGPLGPPLAGPRRRAPRLLHPSWGQTLPGPPPASRILRTRHTSLTRLPTGHLLSGCQ